MKQMKTILVVLDKPKHAQAALAEALTLQSASGAHLHLVSFVWNAIVGQNSMFDAHQRRALKREILRERKAWLRDQITDRGLQAADLTIETVWTSDIAQWVADFSSGGSGPGCDLVIKSVHKSQTLLHTPLDWQLLRTCAVPTLLVGVQRGGRVRKSKQSADVLATLDLRHEDRKHQTMNLRVLDAAARLAQLRGGKLHCVAVVEYSEVLSDLDIVDARRVRKQAIEASDAYLQALIEPYGIPRSRVHRPAGKVGQSVAATARKSRAGLIVVGSAARRQIELPLLGNSAEKILVRSPADVLIVHPQNRLA